MPQPCISLAITEFRPDIPVALGPRLAFTHFSWVLKYCSRVELSVIPVGPPWCLSGLVCYLPEAPCALLEPLEAIAKFPRFLLFPFSNFFLLHFSNFLLLLLINLPGPAFLPVWFCLVSESWSSYHLEVCWSSQGKWLQTINKIEDDLHMFYKNRNLLTFSVKTNGGQKMLWSRYFQIRHIWFVSLRESWCINNEEKYNSIWKKSMLQIAFGKQGWKWFIYFWKWYLSLFMQILILRILKPRKYNFLIHLSYFTGFWILSLEI